MTVEMHLSYLYCSDEWIPMSLGYRICPSLQKEYCWIL